MFINKYPKFFLILFVISINNLANAIGDSVNNPGRTAIGPDEKYFVVTIINRGKTSRTAPPRCTGIFLSPKVILTAKHCTDGLQHGAKLYVYAIETPETFRFANAKNVYYGDSTNLVPNSDYWLIPIYPENIVTIKPSIDASLIVLNLTPSIFANWAQPNLPFPVLYNAHTFFARHQMVPGITHGNNKFPTSTYGIGYGYGDYPDPAQIGLIRTTTDSTGATSDVYLHNVDVSITYTEDHSHYNQLFTVSYYQSSADDGDSGGPLLYFNHEYQIHNILGIVSGGPDINIPRTGGVYNGIFVNYYTYFTDTDLDNIYRIIERNP